MICFCFNNRREGEESVGLGSTLSKLTCPCGPRMWSPRFSRVSTEGKNGTHHKNGKLNKPGRTHSAPFQCHNVLPVVVSQLQLGSSTAHPAVAMELLRSLQCGRAVCSPPEVGKEGRRGQA